LERLLYPAGRDLPAIERLPATLFVLMLLLVYAKDVVIGLISTQSLLSAELFLEI
jgi:hypothetical protein